MAIVSIAQLDFSSEERRCCTKCNKTFDKPKLVQYYACPHCLGKIEENQNNGCQYWFGYLNQREKNEPIPQLCVECEKAVECLLSPHCDTPAAVAEIKKWY
jgi:hypothetical protein